MDGFLRYDTRLKERARQNRKNPTESEKIAWEELFQGKKFHGYKFSRQKMLSGFIVDFYCSELQLVVEIDGGVHEEREEYDRGRTYKLEELGLKIMRFLNEQILTDIEGVHDSLTKFISTKSFPGQAS